MISMMTVRGVDPVVLGELMLTTDLMIMANTATASHLSQEAIDAALGL